MDAINLRTSSLDRCEREDAWRHVVSTMIHDVEVGNMAAGRFAAGISARRHDDIGCGYFWSRPHQLRGGRERIGQSGSGGYLVSWQIRGTAYIEQDGQQWVQTPGMVAIVDGRRPMQVRFPDDVQRIVAKLPARILEPRFAALVSRHALAFEPAGPFAPMLLAHLAELSSDRSQLPGTDLERVAENIANLLHMVAPATDLARCDARQLRRQALLRLIRQHAEDPQLNLASVADKLHVSPRLVQHMLQEENTRFTEVLTQERLQRAAAKLAPGSGLAISQVAYTSGFSDVSHFNHMFKRRYGMSPSEYRRSLA